MTVNVANGSKLSIAQTLTTNNPIQATYEAMHWTLISEVEDAGTVGDSAADITFESLADGRVRHFAGPFDAGAETVVCGHDITDAGQRAVGVAFAARLLTAFKLELTDRPDVDHTNTIKYYGARVLKFDAAVGNARNVIRRNMTLGINTPVIEVAPTADTP